MLVLRALAATSAEGWEEEDEKLRSRAVSDVDRIKNVVVGADDGEEEGGGPLKQPAALPTTFGSFLGARGAALGGSHVRHAEDAKGRGKEEQRSQVEREREETTRGT